MVNIFGKHINYVYFTTRKAFQGNSTVTADNRIEGIALRNSLVLRMNITAASSKQLKCSSHIPILVFKVL